MDRYTLHTLRNGLQVVIEQMPHVRSAAAGFLVRTGARDESRELAGVSHFLEHMMFKGTTQRTWRQITVEFDRMGSIYNAYTSEDRTVYYGWVPQASIARQIELLADMVRSTLPEEEFTTEKNVILEEIAMSADSLEHVAFDFLQEKVFADHPLAWPILGYEQTVRDLARGQMWDYFQRRYTPDNMVLIVAGNVAVADVLALAESLCGSWPPSNDRPVRNLPAPHAGTDVKVVDRFRQQFVALTFPSVGSRDAHAETAAALATILGGDNSRIYWNIVQQGISPRAGAYYLEYTDCGAMILYGACPPDGVERLVDALRAEAKELRESGVREDEVARVKNRRRTTLAIESEAPYHRLTQLIDDMETHGRPRTVEQMLAEVDAVSARTVQEYLERCPIDGGGHLTSVGPRAWPESPGSTM